MIINRLGIVMKNILVITDAVNCVYDIFAITDKEFSIIFTTKSRVIRYSDAKYKLYKANFDLYCSSFIRMKFRRIPKIDVNGIDGIFIDSHISDDSIQSWDENVDIRSKSIQIPTIGCRENIFVPYYDPSLYNPKEMKNVMFIEKYECRVYPITVDEFNLMFELGTDIVFDDTIEDKMDNDERMDVLFSEIFEAMLKRRIPLCMVNGIDGVYFDRMEYKKKKFYPTLRDEEAVNPDGTALRHYGATSSNKTAILTYKYINFAEENIILDTEEQIDDFDDLWKETIDKIEKHLGVCTEEDTTIKYKSVDYDEWHKS